MKDSKGNVLLLGQMVTVTSKLIRGGDHNRRTRTWDKVTIEPVNGIYIGWRTLREGVIHGTKSLNSGFEAEEDPPYLAITGTKIGYLVVTGERQKPFYSDQVEILAMYEHLSFLTSNGALQYETVQTPANPVANVFNEGTRPCTSF